MRAYVERSRTGRANLRMRISAARVWVGHVCMLMFDGARMCVCVGMCVCVCVCMCV